MSDSNASKAAKNDKSVSSPSDVSLEQIIPFLTQQDNDIFLAARTAETPRSIQPMELVADQGDPQPDKLSSLGKLDNIGRPTGLSIKDEQGGSSEFTQIKYNGAGNEVSSFITKIVIPEPNLNQGEWNYKLEKNKEGSWDVFDKKKEDGSWAINPERKRDFGKLTVHQDAKTKQFEIHGTGSDIGRLGDFAKDDGFMSDADLSKVDSITHKMVTAKAVADLLDTTDDKHYSRNQLEEILAKKEAESKLPEFNDEGRSPTAARQLAVGYKQLIADFDKIAQGKTEISTNDLAKYANEQKYAAIAQEINSSVSNYGKIVFPSERLLGRLFEGTLLLKPEEVKAAQEGINTQLRTLNGPSKNLSVNFGETLIEPKPAPGEPAADIGPAEKDRLLILSNNGKECGQIRVRQHTDIIDN